MRVARACGKTQPFGRPEMEIKAQVGFVSSAAARITEPAEFVVGADVVFIDFLLVFVCTVPKQFVGIVVARAQLFILVIARYG